jgi:outer membrane protein assembly factor BamA
MCVGQPLNTDHLGGDLEQLQTQYQPGGNLTMRLEGPRIERNLQRHTAVVSVTVIEGPRTNSTADRATVSIRLTVTEGVRTRVGSADHQRAAVSNGSGAVCTTHLAGGRPIRRGAGSG